MHAICRAAYLRPCSFTGLLPKDAWRCNADPDDAHGRIDEREKVGDRIGARLSLFSLLSLSLEVRPLKSSWESGERRKLLRLCLGRRASRN